MDFCSPKFQRVVWTISLAVLALTGIQTVRLSSAIRTLSTQQEINTQNIQTLAAFLGASSAGAPQLDTPQQ